MPNTNNQFSFLDYTGLSLFWSKVKKIIEDNELVTATALTDLDTRVDNLEDAISDQIISKTYTELKTLRDNGQLIPGQQYRITDYACTTTQGGTKSAGHVFDIIVIADSENKLNEEARAIQHAGDSYFANCDLNAWKIWYSLDNDTARFAWADSTNGKGVIYRMIDEWNNDCPYDFKNIQFNGDWGYWAYTFNWINDNSDNSCEDMSVAQYAYPNDEEGYSHTCSNVIKPCEDASSTEYGYPLKLNNIVFLNTHSYYRGHFCGCYSNTFDSNCYNNTFGNENSFNTLSKGCYANSFRDYCQYNIFGNNCNNNSSGDKFTNNTFGNNCFANIFGDNYYNNSFGNNCYSNIFGNNCYSNTFGNSCYHNTFEDSCSYNTFGDDCQYIKFASSSSATTKYNYYQYNHFGDGCQYILFKGAEKASSSVQVQNYNFAQGLQGTSSTYLTIDGVRSRTFETKVAKNSNGDLKIYCEADLIMTN